MGSLQGIEYIGLGDYFREPENEYSYAAVRNRLLVAISLAEIEGYSATHEALIEILKELESSRDPNSSSQPEPQIDYA
ncbi:MAG: hypothetical protein AAFN50_13045 [Pseudomonadota bacterium]